MESLWKDRRPPNPYRVDDIYHIAESSNNTEWKTNEVWTMERWIQVFAESLAELTTAFKEASAKGKILSWDKVR